MCGCVYVNLTSHFLGRSSSNLPIKLTVVTSIIFIVFMFFFVVIVVVVIVVVIATNVGAHTLAQKPA